MNRIFVFLMFVFLGQTTGWSADQIGTPRPPFLAVMPDRSAWIISYKGTNSNATMAGGPGSDAKPDYEAKARSIMVVKNGTLRQEIIEWSNGGKTESWSRQGLRLSESPGSDILLRTIDDAREDFPLVSWINSNNFVGVQEVEDQTCYAYETKELTIEISPGRFTADSWASLKGNSRSRDSIVKRAYISVETKRPVGAQIGNRKVTFSFLPAPTAALVVPDKFQTQFKKWSDDIALSRRKPPAP